MNTTIRERARNPVFGVFVVVIVFVVFIVVVVVVVDYRFLRGKASMKLPGVELVIFAPIVSA